MLGRELLYLISTNTTYLCFTGPAYKKEKDKKERTRCFCVVFIVASSVSNEYHYAAMNIMDLIIVLELEPFSFCGVTCHNIPALICCIYTCVDLAAILVTVSETRGACLFGKEYSDEAMGNEIIVLKGFCKPLSSFWVSFYSFIDNMTIIGGSLTLAPPPPPDGSSTGSPTAARLRRARS